MNNKEIKSKEISKYKDFSFFFPIILVIITIFICFSALNVSNDIDVIENIDKENVDTLISDIIINDIRNETINITNNLFKGSIILDEKNNYSCEIKIFLKNNFSYPVVFNKVITDMKNIDIYNNPNVIYTVNSNIKDNTLNSNDSGIITILFKNKNDLKVDNDLELYFKLDFSDII